MRWLRRSLLLVGMVFGLLLATFLLFIGSGLHDVADVGQPIPQTISLSDLSAKGPAENAHVELTDFTFGQPVIEKDRENWERVWLPLEPAGKGKLVARPVVLLLDDYPDKASLDRLLGRKSVTALVTASLPDGSHRRIRPSETFRRAQPAIDPNQALFLRAEPILNIGGGLMILGEGRIFDRLYARIFRIAGWSALAVALVCAVLLLRGLNRQPVDVPRQPTPPDEEYLRTRLPLEAPRSVHIFRFWGALGRSLGLVFGAVLFFVFSFASLAMCATFADRSQAIPAILSALFALGLFISVFVLLGLAIKVFTGAALRIAICPSGLRWRKLGRDRIALWSDIAKFHRAVSIRYNTRMDSVVIVLYSGESLHFWDHSLSDYPTFADAVGSEFYEGRQRTGTDALGASIGRALPDHLRQDWTG